MAASARVVGPGLADAVAGGPSCGAARAVPFADTKEWHWEQVVGEDLVGQRRPEAASRSVLPAARVDQSGPHEEGSRRWRRRSGSRVRRVRRGCGGTGGRVLGGQTHDQARGPRRGTAGAGVVHRRMRSRQFPVHDRATRPGVRLREQADVRQDVRALAAGRRRTPPLRGVRAPARRLPDGAAAAAKQPLNVHHSTPDLGTDGSDTQSARPPWLCVHGSSRYEPSAHGEVLAVTKGQTSS